MTNKSSDLLSVVRPMKDTSPGLRFRQGSVIYWNETTGENQVDVGGAVMVNLPLMNASDVRVITEGSTVSIFSTPENGMFIAGQIVRPGTESAQRAIQAALGLGSYAYDSTQCQVANETFGRDPDVGTTGPAVNALIGPSRRALVTMGGLLLAGAATVSAAMILYGYSDTFEDYEYPFLEMMLSIYAQSGQAQLAASRTEEITLPSEGNWAFMIKYATLSGSGTSSFFSDRSIRVLPI